MKRKPAMPTVGAIVIDLQDQPVMICCPDCEKLVFGNELDALVIEFTGTVAPVFKIHTGEVDQGEICDFCNCEVLKAK